MNKFPSYEQVRKSLSPKQKVGQLFMPAAFINDTEDEVEKLETLIKKHAIGSLCFFHSRASAATNFEGKKEVIHNAESYDRLRYLITRYQQAAPYPLLIAIDAEWGLAMRIENTPQYPYAITLGAMQEQEKLVYEVGKSIAKDCKEAGIHWNLSPVVDINLNPDNPVIGYRSFGKDKHVVAQYAKAYLNGMRSQGVLNAIKHFPGHGDTATDSHLGLPIIDKSETELLENELYPFLQLMQEDIDAIMVGHLAVPVLSEGKKISSSISPGILTGFLREKLGWEGVIISDALNMHAITKDLPEKGGVEHAAFNAGNDVLCFADHPAEGILRIVESSSEKRIEQSFKRFWQLKEKAMGPPKTNEATNLEYDDLMLQLAQNSLSVLKGTPNELSEFREGGFRYVQIGKQKGYFSDHLNTHKTDESAVLVGIFPRQVKPNNSFGFTEKEVLLMHQLANRPNTVIYLFGNPFVLHLFPWNKAKLIVIAYQDLVEFQKNAIAHFEGKLSATGQVPVTLKNTNG